MIGSRSPDLVRLSVASDGYCFHSTTLKDALKTCELETFVSSSERPPASVWGKIKVDSEADFNSLRPEIDICNDSVIPKRREIPGIDQRGVSLERAFQTRTPSSVPRLQRLMREMKAVQTKLHPHITVLPGEEDIGFWHCVIDGPSSTPYTNSAWTLVISFPEDYPLRAPEIRFVTPILHCNVNAHGKICHSIFDRNYSSDTTVSTLLEHVYGLLLTPDKDDPLDSTLALSARNDSGAYVRPQSICRCLC